jgi:diguanylate cyclase (GGDEF)-like protein
MIPDEPTAGKNDSPRIELDDEYVTERLNFLRLDNKDIETLKSAHPLLSQIAGPIIDELYAHLLSYDDTARFIENEKLLQHLKEVQTQYFEELSCGKYDAEYVKKRLRIGLVHHNIGLEPHLYISTYAIYIQLLSHRLRELDNGDSNIVLQDLLGSLSKVISFDMGLAIEAYIQAGQHHIHQQMDQLYTINKAALALNSAASLDSKLEIILQHGTHIAGGDASSVAFFDLNRKQFTHWTTYELSNAFVSRMSFKPGGLADRVILRNTYILSNDRPESEHRLSRLARREGIKSFICLPLIYQKKPLGVIYVYNKESDTFTNEQITLLTTLSNLAAGAIANVQLLEATEKMATVDALTGLLNRRKYDELIEQELKRAIRYQRELSLLLLDIDHFKKINDTYGHQVGDQALQHISNIISEDLRNVDTAARYGGEEFAVILPETGIEGASLVAKRIRVSISSNPLSIDRELSIPMTVSIGIASYPDCADTAKRLSQYADQALYESKSAGRNRVTAYQNIAEKSVD